MIRRLLADARAFCRDKSANFALMTALCAVPMLGMMGLGIDYAILLSNKSKLDAAADAAAVSAVVKARAVLTGGGTILAAETQGQAQGTAAFAANAGTVNFNTSSNPVTAHVVLTPNLINPQILNASVTYNMTSTSQFGKLFNIGSYTISGSSSSSTVLTPYYQFIFVVDTSNSMAVGGTSTYIADLENDPFVTAHSLSNEPCAFACHNQETSWSGNTPQNGYPYDLRAYARNKNWMLKIDYVNAAVSQFINDLQSATSNQPGQFSVGVETFGSASGLVAGSENGSLAPIWMQPVYPPSAALPAATKIDVELATGNNNNHGYTMTSEALTNTLNHIQNVGDGSSITSQATYVIFVSDGIEDTPSPGYSWGRQTDIPGKIENGSTPMNYAPACANLKQKGVTMVTIEATYASISNQIVDDAQYDTLVQPLSAPNTPNMQTTMQACATDPTWAYQANDGPGINSAVSAILQRVLQGLTRITN